MNLSNNTILITGGATGIGLAMAEQFLQLKNIVIICGRRQEKLDEAKKKFPEIIIRQCDLTQKSDRENLFNWSAKNYPALNVLINNAGIQNDVNVTHGLNVDHLTQEVETNFIAPVHLGALFTEHLKTKENAAIINITSGLAFTPLAFMPVYCATKAALHSYSLSLRHLLANSGIKVFEIAPPIVDTELDRGARATRSYSDRGMKAEEFTGHALEALKNDVFEFAVGFAENLRQKREAMFSVLNQAR